MKAVSTKNKNWIVIIFLACICIIYSLRLINIEQDIAPWGISMYQPVDEGPYAYLAINEKIYGTIKPEIEVDGNEVPLLISENFITNVPGNLFNIIGFKIFGNNYYALRVPYVIFGLINLILFGLILQRIREVYGKGRKSELIGQYILLLWMALDFTFFNAGRIVEPTIVRLVFVQLVVLVHLSYPSSNRVRFFLMGLLITFSVFLVYITNIFLYLAAFIVLIINLRREGIKTFLQQLIWFAAGCMIMFIAAEAYYYFVWDTEAVINSINTIRSFADNSSAELTAKTDLPIIINILVVYARIVSSNPFFYNMPFLFAGTICLPAVFRAARRERDQRFDFLWAILFSFLAQTMVSTDTITRKMIVIFPVFLALLYALYLQGEVPCFVGAGQAGSREYGSGKRAGISQKRNRRLAIIGNVLLWGWAFVNVVIAYLYRTELYDWTSGDFDSRAKLMVLALLVFPLFLLTACSMICFLLQINTEDLGGEWKDRIILFFIACACLCNVLFCYRYYWRNPKFTEKESMEMLDEHTDGKYILGGGFQLGWTLYNHMKPIVNTPVKVMEIAGALDNTMFLDYANNSGGLTSYFEDTFYEAARNGIYFIPKLEIKRGYKTFGKSRNMCLYDICDLDTYREYRLTKARETEDVLRTAYDAYYTDLEDLGAGEYSSLKREFLKARKRFLAWRYPVSSSDKYPERGKMATDFCGDIMSNVSTRIYGNVYGDIYGDINAEIDGNVFGNIYGDVNQNINGSVYGNIIGSLNATISGDLYGGLTGNDQKGSILGKNFSRSVLPQLVVGEEEEETIKPEEASDEYQYISRPVKKDVEKNIIGNTDYKIFGDVKKNIFGDVNGDIYGNVEGNIYGDVNARIYGKVKGYIFGKINEKKGGKVDGEAISLQ